ncbi:hypothetical protein SARC_03206 [Sphaeroforma arctica JP610]|uniref:SHSP domain-containing protein n=1 Tax=Sphaeroforma arctica JP610 TaxID=667725 RepID=A0A0L0G6H2_9EUKA|nr:hypothetical protein SARC_03206 [Sphaeroforma arctica JP610]KNC84587.1 hypothetical protein SARC_03206 [Sphaeroforma arctica JP610]|eukprot:XP_014158489.1 hypothetical protein SARC_03206 [Sphaeroforma arctica JP610]
MLPMANHPAWGRYLSSVFAARKQRILPYDFVVLSHPTEAERTLCLYSVYIAIQKDDVAVRYNDDRLIVEGSMDTGNIEKEGRNWKMKERSASSFRREFNVPRGMDPNKIKTSRRNGVLEIDLPELQTLSSDNKGHTLAIEE